MDRISLVIAFGAGLLSFLNPCVLPLIPGFLGYLSGVSSTGFMEGRLRIFLCSCFFVLGFAAVFALLGVLLNTILQQISFTAREWLGRLGGTVIIVFGLHLLGLLEIPWLEKEHKVQLKSGMHLSPYVLSFVFGAVFAVSWTPCVGAILGSILALAANRPGESFWLLLSYALGLGIPFLLTGLFASFAAKLIGRLARYLWIIHRLTGVFLILLGILVFTDQLAVLVSGTFLNEELLRQI
ncbi:MAG: cytochrome c biogenesis protein CcdA [Candidatus Omnitrophica bacterium]|nr:cytochrome c biogenesis protein CcdA [Candidatus Omnitrophota bacterium]